MDDVARAARYAPSVHALLTLLAVATSSPSSPGAPAGAPAGVPAGMVACKAAVLDLTPGEGVTVERARALTELVTSEVSQHLLDGKCSVLSRAEIKALVSFEVERQLSGCDATSCLGEIGDALGVDHLVMGTISRIDARTLVSLRLVDMRAMHVERRVTDSFEGPDDDALSWISWLAKRVSLTDEADAGKRPVVDTPSVVERKATAWRNLAWTGLGTGVGVLVVAGALGGTALGISTALPSMKTARATNRAQIASLEDSGPWLAGGANLGLYIGSALLVAGGALWFAPGEELVVTNDRPALAPAPAGPLAGGTQ